MKQIGGISLCAWMAALTGPSLANIYVVTIFDELPRAESVASVESYRPISGPSVFVSDETIKEFLSDGENLKIEGWQEIPKKHPEIWKRIKNEFFDYYGGFHSKGAFVDQKYKIFRWRLLSPHLLMISNFKETEKTLIYLKDPKRVAKIEGRSITDYVRTLGDAKNDSDSLYLLEALKYNEDLNPLIKKIEETQTESNKQAQPTASKR